MMYSQNFVVTIKCDGKILRDDKSGSVYLPFGAEYSVFLKNKDNRRALVDIEVDGQNVLNGNKLILNGNESQEIKGFMRNMNVTNRFKFIHKTREIQKYRGDRIDDGLVRVSYQFEKYKEEPIVTINNPTPTWTYYNTGPNTGGSWWASNSSVNLRSASNLDAVYTCCFSDCKSSTPLADEGITVKGSKINQNYVYGNINSLESDIHTIVLHLKGITSLKKEVHKPVTVKMKSKCIVCGRGNKSSNNFCYNCGAFLE